MMLLWFSRLQIGEAGFTYREERSDILWIHPGEMMFLRLRRRNDPGAYFVPTNDTPALNGRYGEWKQINYMKINRLRPIVLLLHGDTSG